MRARIRPVAATLAGCATLLLLAGCAQPAPAIQASTIAELSSAYVDAGGECTDLVEQFRDGDDAPAVATCGTDTVLTVAADASQASQLRTGAMLRDVPVLAAGLWIVQDPEVESLQASLGGDVYAIEPADGPANLADALVLDASGVVAQDAVGIDDEAAPVEAEGTVITIVVDPACAYCGEFEAANRDRLADWAADGTATVAYVPVALHDDLATGFSSSLGVAALACVADADPDEALPLLQSMLDEGDALDASTVVDLAETASAGAGECVTEGTFAWWTRQATLRALEGATMPDGQQLGGVPSVYVDERLYSGDVSDPAAFAAFVAEG